MHIAKDPNQTQLWTVIPYAIATPITGMSTHPFHHNLQHVSDTFETVLVAFISDRMKLRGTIMLAVLPIAIAGYAAIGNIKGADARFAMTCLMAIGMYCAVPCVLVWNSNNSAGHYKRATTSALQLAVANCGGFVAGKLSHSVFQNVDATYIHKSMEHFTDPLVF